MQTSIFDYLNDLPQAGDKIGKNIKVIGERETWGGKPIMLYNDNEYLKGVLTEDWANHVEELTC